MEYDYDLVVIGGGAAGLTASGIAASLAAKTLMIERERLGGDCTWHGCVPSKTLLHAANLAHQARTASEFGVDAGGVMVDFGRVMAKVRAIRQHVYEEADAPDKFEAMGVEVAKGEASFVNPHTVEIVGDGGSRRVTARKIIVAAGGRARVPDLPGLDEVRHVTNVGLFEMTELPARLAILGAGPIGTEMAQAFQRLGSQVTVVERGDHILSHDDTELSDLLHASLKSEGVAYRMGASAQSVEPLAGGGLRLFLDKGEPVHADALLTSVGRIPNVETLGLEAAGVDYTEKGITVDASCKTNVGHIWAVGDVTGRYQFTHMSEHMAKTAATNALLKLPSKIDTENVPWATYTSPELAHVGKTQEQLEDEGVGFETYRFPYDKLDRALDARRLDRTRQGARAQARRQDLWRIGPGRARWRDRLHVRRRDDQRRDAAPPLRHHLPLSGVGIGRKARRRSVVRRQAERRAGPLRQNHLRLRRRGPTSRSRPHRLDARAARRPKPTRRARSLRGGAD